MLWFLWSALVRSVQALACTMQKRACTTRKIEFSQQLIIGFCWNLKLWLIRPISTATINFSKICARMHMCLGNNRTYLYLGVPKRSPGLGWDLNLFQPITGQDLPCPIWKKDSCYDGTSDPGLWLVEIVEVPSQNRSPIWDGTSFNQSQARIEVPS
jgi:hypothetical protein